MFLVFTAFNKTVFCILYHIPSVHPSSNHEDTTITTIILALLSSYAFSIIDSKLIWQQLQHVLWATCTNTLAPAICSLDISTKELHLAP